MNREMKIKSGNADHRNPEAEKSFSVTRQKTVPVLCEQEALGI